MAVSAMAGLALVVGSPIDAPAAGVRGTEDGRIVAPDREIAGLTGGELLGDGWYTVLTLPASVNPVFGNGERCVHAGRNGKLLIALNPGPICTVEQGTAVFVFGFTSFCDTAEPPPFFAVGEQAQRDCAWDTLADVTGITVRVDGGVPTDIHTPRFATCSPQREAVLRADNFLGVDAQAMTFTACGWIAWVTDLPPGRHMIRSVATFADGGEHLYAPVVDVAHHR
jgi:hypothetical protein